MNKCFNGAIRYANTGIAFLYELQAQYSIFQVELVVILLAVVLL